MAADSAPQFVEYTALVDSSMIGCPLKHQNSYGQLSARRQAETSHHLRRDHCRTSHQPGSRWVQQRKQYLAGLVATLRDPYTSIYKQR